MRIQYCTLSVVTSQQITLICKEESNEHCLNSEVSKIIILVFDTNQLQLINICFCKTKAIFGKEYHVYHNALEPLDSCSGGKELIIAEVQ